MAKSSSKTLDPATSGAAVRFHELVDELHLLLTAFPDLHDAFDADDLPITFILKRGSRRAAATTAPKHKRGASSPAGSGAARRPRKTGSRVGRTGQK
jgi:hypothetical protein